MTDISRRGFLGGVAAAAAVAALPIPAPLPETYTMVFEPGPIFEGAVGTYNGVLIREVWAIDLNHAYPVDTHSYTC